MKKFWEISAHRVARGLVRWFILTNLLVWLAHGLGWWPFKVLLFVCLAFLPGVALLRAMRIVLRSFPVGVLYSFGLSVLTLMVSGLVANQIFYLFGASRPLGLWGAFGAWDATTAALIVLSVRSNHQSLRLKSWRVKAFSKPVRLLVVLSLLLPCMAMMGAFRLNNGGSAVLAELTLCYAAALLVYAFVLRRRLPDGLLAWLVFIIGLTVLLMTSLRGWDVVGHDIEREFRVYTLTHLHGRWNIGLYRDPYNACLSITILPEMFAKLLGISGLVVFKVILPMVFAACPVVVYILLRQYAFKLAALAGSLLFICYPTFVTDSAMLTRQGVALLFFALALLVISNKAQKKRYKLLFSLCALGVVLSHYSTAYMFVTLFVVAVGCKMLLGWWQRRRLPAQARARPTVVSPFFAGLVLLMTFMWYTQLTATSGGLVTTLHASFSNISKLFSADNKSSDTSAALLFAGGRTQVDLYQSYLTDSSQTYALKASRLTEYFPGLTSDALPLTSVGQQAHKIGIDPAITTTLRQNFAKVLQVLALVGVLYATYRLLRRRPDAIELDFICLNLAGLVLLVLMVMLPVLSVNYGILRAFQQNLVFLILPITLLFARVGRYVWGWLSTTFATVSIVLLFFLFTGLGAQVLGAASPSLSMNNQGLYFGLYYSPAADARSFAWLKAHVSKGSDVRAANFNRAFMHDPTYPFSRTGILPSQTGDSSYVYLDTAQVQAQRLYTYYESSPLVLTFPLDYYNVTKSQIYSTGSTRIYR